jgi:RHS repeat-associated protein
VHAALTGNVVVTVVDASGNPRSDSEVLAQDSAGSFADVQYTGANGQVTFTLDGGDFQFATPGEGYYFFWSTTCSVPSCTAATITVQQPVVVTVVDTDGNPQANQEVIAQHDDGTFENMSFTGDDGTVTLSVVAGTYQFVAPVNNTYFSTNVDCVVPGCTAATITIPPPVTVTVVDSDGNPSAGLEVLAQDADGNYQGNCTTDDQGHAVLSVEPGTYHFVVPINDVLFSSDACAVPGCTAVTIALPHPVLVSALGSDGSPLGDLPVRAQAPDGSYVSNVSTDDQGHATMFVPPGSYRFVIFIDNVMFASGAPGSCTVPGCTSATIAVPPPVVVTVLDGSGNPIASQDVTAQEAACGATVLETTDAAGHASFELSDGAWQFQATCGCETFYSGDVGSCVVPGCLSAQIIMICGGCTGRPDGTACNDGNACTQTDTCQAGACVGSNPVTCSAQDQCHTAGTCNTSTGVCSNPAKADGTACDDGNACTLSDACQAGTCAAGSQVTCTAQDQCHVAGTCNTSTGICSNPAKTDGTFCDDGDGCTTDDACRAGSCSGAPSCAGVFQLTEAATQFLSTAHLTVAPTADRTAITMGDTLSVSANVTYSGVAVTIVENLDNKNLTAATVTTAGWEERLDYFSPSQNSWVPLAGAAFDSAGHQISSATANSTVVNVFLRGAPGPGVHAPTSTLASSSFDAGATGNWQAVFQAVLGADFSLLADRTRATALRLAFKLNSGSGGVGDEVSVDVTSALAALTAPQVSNLGATAALNLFGKHNQPTVTLTSGSSGPLSLFSARAFTGQVPVGSGTAVFLTLAQQQQLPAGQLATAQQQYLSELQDDAGRHSFLNVQTQNGGNAGGSLTLDSKVPLLSTSVTAPSDIFAGTQADYPVQLQNIGSAPASAISVTEADNFVPFSSSTTLPGTLDPAQTATSTINFVVPTSPSLARIATVTSWTDSNGNLYGPVLSTGSTLHLHPQGLLALSQPLTQIVGDTVTMTLTATDQLDRPAVGLPVHVSIAGPNAQTQDLVTGSDGTAQLSYVGASIGKDTVVASATIVTQPIQSAPLTVTWATAAVGTPCTGRATPLDVVMVIDVSPSMMDEGKIQAAKSATDAFIDDLDFTRDQVGAVLFTASAALYAPLTSDGATAKSEMNSAIDSFIAACAGFCPGGTNIGAGLNAALDELAGSRHRAGATPVIVFLTDGGNSVGDPEPALARLAASGVRSLALGLGSDADTTMLGRIASTKNDYFYSPSGSELAWAYNSINQDLCRNREPFVSAGGDQGFYEVRLPDLLTLHGEVHDDGPAGDTRFTSTWSLVSGPAPVSFTDASSPETEVLFTEPGTYVLQLEATDGFLDVADRATITVDPDPSIVGANLAIALGSAGPLTTGAAETATATLTDGLGAPISNFLIQFTVAGANATTTTTGGVTNGVGVATFTYVGAKPGTDVIHATALGSTLQLSSPSVSVSWTEPATGGPILTQGWIAEPAHQSTLMGQVRVVLSPTVTLTSGALTYWPAAHPDQVHTLAASVSGAPSAILATFDTTVLANDAYIIKLDGTDSAGDEKVSEVAVTVKGDYKPGRVVVELTDFSIPIAGLPITVGRRYDSLEKDNVGDFGHGWSLLIGHPRLEVDPTHAVTITLPDGRRATFTFGGTPYPFPFSFLFTPRFLPESGVFGSLTSDGCDPLVSASGQLLCFEGTELQFAPTTYTYTDAFGRQFVMAATGELKSIKDRQGNTLTFEPNGIISGTGKAVTFQRDATGRIAAVLSPLFGPALNQQIEYDYHYDDNGDLEHVDLPPSDGLTATAIYSYLDHRLLTTKDPRGNAARTSTYYDDGRLETDTDALHNVTSYTYDLATRTTRTTYPDTGVLTQVFDDRGLVLTETDQLGHTTTHVYDDNRNETSRTNAVGETTTMTYDPNGNLASSTDSVTRTTSTVYNAFSQPMTFTDPLGHTTTIDYDDRGVPIRISDALGTRYTFTSSEQGLPLTVDDAVSNRAYLTYDGSGDETSRTDRISRTTTSTYDELGRRLTQTTARGGVTQYNYTFRGQIASILDPATTPNFRVFEHDQDDNVTRETWPLAGHTTRYDYDELNHLTLVTYGDNTTVGYTYDFRGNMLTETDELGRTTTYHYDLAGQLRTTEFPDHKIVQRDYDGLGRLHSVTDERNNTTTYEYDPGCGCSDRVTKVTDPLEHATITTYDGAGRRHSVKDPAGHETVFAYDVRDHLVETDYADGTSVQDVYDTRGRRTSSTDQMNLTTIYGYDDQGQLVSVADPLANVTTYAYDLDGNLESVTDANNHTTTYGYDLAGRKTSRALPLGMSESFGYDAVGSKTAHTDFRGKTTTLVYDVRGRLLSKTPDPSLGELQRSYLYYADGTRQSMTDPSGTTTYTYDSRNRMLTKATPEGTLTYTYDDAGNLATIDSSNPNGTSVAYAWDAANRLASVTDNRAGGVTTPTFTATGRPSTLSQPNGVGLTYSYDSLDRVLSMSWQQGASPAFGSWRYSYNNRGQRLTATDIAGRSAAYGYDNASRLTSETITGDPRGANFNGALSYVLDGTGNRLSRTSTVGALGAQAFTFNANDELDSNVYDANGNTTESGGHAYAYDFEDRLVSVDSGAVTFVYDCDGRRVAKTVSGTTTRYLLDDLNPTGLLQVLEEASAGAVRTRFTYGDMLVSQTRNASSAPTASYYGYDVYGNITFLTNASGAVTDTYSYDTWGNVVGSTGTTQNTRAFSGEEVDPDLGFVMLRARQYVPTTGRFQEGDLVRGDSLRPLTHNRYLYAVADPVNFRDPSGLAGSPGAPAIPGPRSSSDEYGTLVAGIAGLLVATTATVYLGRNGVYTATQAQGALGAAGWQVACEFSSATVRPSDAAMPWMALRNCQPVQEDDGCDTGTGGGAGGSGSSGSSGSGGGAEDCEKQWDEARERCRKMLCQRNPPRGLTGGHNKVEECARGYVSEACGGNPVDYGPNALH